MPDTRTPSAADWLGRGLTFLLGVIALLGLWDLSTDPVREVLGLHGAIDLALVAVAAGSAIWLARGWLEAERSLKGVQASLESHRAERDAWRERAQVSLRGLGEAIDRQFSAWGLTPAEKETALFLLKGFSHKEVAALSGKSERTVRQHSVAVYRKSGLGGRAELAAFFFEDMLLPGSEPLAAQESAPVPLNDRP